MINKNIAMVGLLTLASSVFAHPFDAGRWVNGDFFVTTSQHQPIPVGGQVATHRISYTLPSGVRSSTDMCKVTNDTTLTCWMTNDQLVVNTTTFTATLSPSGGNPYYFYVPGHEPASSPLSGHWSRQGSNLSHCDNAKLKELRVPNQPVDAKNFRKVVYIGYDDVTYDGGNLNVVRYTPTGQLVLGDARSDSDYFFIRYALYDKNHQPIYNIADIDKVAFLNDTTVIYKYDANCDIAK